MPPDITNYNYTDKYFVRFIIVPCVGGYLSLLSSNSYFIPIDMGSAVVRVLFDAAKSRKCKGNPKRKVAFEEVSHHFENGTHIGFYQRNDYPEQWAIICHAPDGKLVTVVHEYREDDEGIYIWIVTLWKTTKGELGGIK